MKDGRFIINNGNKIMTGGNLIVNESCFTLIQRNFTFTSGNQIVTHGSFTETHGSFTETHGRKNNRRKIPKNYEFLVTAYLKKRHKIKLLFLLGSLTNKAITKQHKLLIKPNKQQIK